MKYREQKGGVRAGTAPMKVSRWHRAEQGEISQPELEAGTPGKAGVMSLKGQIRRMDGLH